MNGKLDFLLRYICQLVHENYILIYCSYIKHIYRWAKFAFLINFYFFYLTGLKFLFLQKPITKRILFSKFAMPFVNNFMAQCNDFLCWLNLYLVISTVLCKCRRRRNVKMSLSSKLSTIILLEYSYWWWCQFTSSVKYRI